MDLRQPAVRALRSQWCVTASPPPLWRVVSSFSARRGHHACYVLRLPAVAAGLPLTAPSRLAGALGQPVCHLTLGLDRRCNQEDTHDAGQPTRENWIRRTWALPSWILDGGIYLLASLPLRSPKNGVAAPG